MDKDTEQEGVKTTVIKITKQVVTRITLHNFVTDVPVEFITEHGDLVVIPAGTPMPMIEESEVESI